MERISECTDDCGLPCLGSICPYHEIHRFYCDECGDESVLYEYEDQQLCPDCLCKKFKKVEGSDDE